MPCTAGACTANTSATCATTDIVCDSSGAAFQPKEVVCSFVCSGVCSACIVSPMTSYAGPRSKSPMFVRSLGKDD